jgi:hypothetical protein
VKSIVYSDLDSIGIRSTGYLVRKEKGPWIKQNRTEKETRGSRQEEVKERPEEKGRKQCVDFRASIIGNFVVVFISYWNEALPSSLRERKKRAHAVSARQKGVHGSARNVPRRIQQKVEVGLRAPLAGQWDVLNLYEGVYAYEIDLVPWKHPWGY